MFNARFPMITVCIGSCTEEVFWSSPQSLMHHLLHLSFWPESLFTHHLFERSKDVLIIWGKVRWICGCGRHLKCRSIMVSHLHSSESIWCKTVPLSCMFLEECHHYVASVMSYRLLALCCHLQDTPYVISNYAISSH